MSANDPFTPGIAPDHLAVGRVLSPHGLRGEVRVEPLTALPEHFAAGRRLWIGQDAHEVEASRRQKGFILLKLSGVASAEAAEALRAVR